MRMSVVRTIYRREIRDLLRDRRTLFTMLLLPLLLYPVLMLGFTQVALSRTKELRKRESAVMITVGDRVLSRDSVPAAGSDLETRILDVETFVFRDLPDPAAAVQSGDLALWARIPGDLDEQLRAVLASSDGTGRVEIPAHFRSADEASKAAFEAFQGALRAWRSERLPVQLEVEDLSSATQRGGQVFGGVLAMMVVIMALTGAFYPALDIAAGEKERGTLETLLLSPASRRELVVGKFLTVMTIAVVAALCNLGSMAATFSGFSSMIPAGAAISLGFSIRSLIVVLLGLLLLTALFSALTLAMSTFARSYKEGQTYLTPLFIVVMPLGMVGMLPDMDLDVGMALIPVANVVLLMKGLFKESQPLAEVLTRPETLVTLGSLAVLALAAIHWTTGLFEREEVLFREGKQVLGLRPPPGMPRPLRPGAGVALLGLFLGISILYYSWAWFGGQPLVALLLSMGGLGVMSLLLPAITMVRIVPGLGLGLPTARAVLVGILIGAAGWGLSLAVGWLQREVLGDSSASAEALAEALGPLMEQPLVVTLLLLAVLPAVAEELLFRGLILQGFRGSLGPTRAVIASAVAFGVFHLDPHRFFPQFIFGLILGFAALRTGSIYAAIIAHALHNAVLFGLAEWGGDRAEAFLESPSRVLALGAAGAAVALAVLLGIGRTAGSGEATRPP